MLRQTLALPVMLMVINGCISSVSHSAAPVSLPVSVIFESIHCSRSDSSPKLIIVSDEAQLQGNSFLPAERVDARYGKLPGVDFTSQRVLLVSMGQKRTGGYRITLMTDSAVVSKGVAQITLLWTEPSADDIVTQALTHPCILLAIPKGNYTRVAIFDQTGKLQLEAAVPVP